MGLLLERRTRENTPRQNWSDGTVSKNLPYMHEDLSSISSTNILKYSRYGGVHL